MRDGLARGVPTTQIPPGSRVVTQAQSPSSFRQAAFEVQRYLSDEIAPLMVADAAETLVSQPPEVAARVVAEWMSTQYRDRASAVPASDLVFHALSKLHQLAELDLVPKAAGMRCVLRAAQLLVAVCPEEERETLKLRVSRLGEAETVLTSRAEYLHGSGGGGGRPAAPGQAPAEPDAPPADAVAQGARALALLIRRLRRFAPAQPAPATPSGAPAPAGVSLGALAPRDVELLAQVLASAALQSQTPDELEGHLARVQEHGVAASMDDVFRALGRSVPGWTALPDAKGNPVPVPASRSVEAMNRIVSLGRDPEEKAKRWGEMIYAAIEQLNEGRLAQAVCILEAARRLIEEKKPDATIVAQVLAQSQAAVSEAVVRRIVEVPEKHGLLRKVLEFFPVYRTEGLLSSLDGEMRRERRKLLLALLECHGPAAREVAIARLAACLSGQPPDEKGWYRRNLAFLMRRIPRSRDDQLEHEIALLRTMIGRGEPAISAKEAIGALGQLRRPEVERILVGRLRELEGEVASASGREEAWELMDRICAALARQGTREAVREVARHGLSRKPAFGDSMARLEHLAWLDLSVDPEQLALFVRGIRELLPSKMLGFVVKRSTHDLECMVHAISGTSTEEVRSLLAELARTFQGKPLGESVAQALAKLEPRTRTASATEALSGDLEQFGLPNLLQSLANTGSTGELVIFDRDRVRRATLALLNGKIARIEGPRVQGAEALYQVLEKPFPGTFVFRAVSVAGPPAGTEPLDPLEVLLEGLRRHDEYQQARAVAPDGITLEAGTAAAIRPEDETDTDLTRAVWSRAAAGTPPDVCDAETPTDPFRVRRLYACWLEQGALRPRVATATG